MARIGEWFSDHPLADWGVACLVLLLHLAAAQRWEFLNLIASVNAANRNDLFVTGAQVIALVGGLCAIGVSVVLALQGKRGAALRRENSRDLIRNWRWMLGGTVLCAALCMLALGLDGANAPATAVAGWVFELAILSATAAVVRLVWLVGAVLAVADAEASDDDTRPPAPPLGTRWRPSTSGPDGPQSPDQRIAV